MVCYIQSIKHRNYEHLKCLLEFFNMRVHVYHPPGQSFMQACLGKQALVLFWVSSQALGYFIIWQMATFSYEQLGTFSYDQLATFSYMMRKDKWSTVSSRFRINQSRRKFVPPAGLKPCSLRIAKASQLFNSGTKLYSNVSKNKENRSFWHIKW